MLSNLQHCCFRINIVRFVKIGFKGSGSWTRLDSSILFLSERLSSRNLGKAVYQVSFESIQWFLEFRDQFSLEVSMFGSFIGIHSVVPEISRFLFSGF